MARRPPDPTTKYWLVAARTSPNFAALPPTSLWEWLAPEALLQTPRPRDARLAIAIEIDDLRLPFEEFLAEARRRFPNACFFALSQRDSARLALHCLRTGFDDFLLHPCSELALTQAAERAASLRRPAWDRPQSAEPASVLTAIAASTSTNHVQWLTVQYLKRLWNARSVAWCAVQGFGWKIEASTETDADAAEAIPKAVVRAWKPARRGSHRFLPMRTRAQGFLWIDRARTSTKPRETRTALVIEHAEIALTNLRKYETVKRQTLTDDLTGTYNARYFKQLVAWHANKFKSTGDGFSLLFIDLDRFKSVNDTYGHAVGSELLIAIARSLKNELRGHDPLFRYGGDEFVVLLSKAAAARAAQIAERLRKKIETRAFAILGHDIRVTLSIGVAAFPEHATTTAELLQLADAAMYQAKRESRNAVRTAGVPGSPPERDRPPEVER